MADLQTDAPPQVIDFETFAAMRGASFADFGDAGAHSPAGHMPKSNWRRLMKALAEQNAELAKRRSELREEYQRLVAEGKVRPPSRIEELLAIANGHEDRAQTHAARRVLAKRGIDWRTER
jgi:hypothetical protein